MDDVAGVEVGQAASHVQRDALAVVVPGVAHGAAPQGVVQVPLLHKRRQQHRALAPLHSTEPSGEWGLLPGDVQQKGGWLYRFLFSMNF